MKPLQPLVSLFLFSLLLLACKRESTIDRIDFGYSYLPLEKGLWMTYDVDSIVFDEFQQSVDTFSFQLRDECVETYLDLTGRDVYRFERFKRIQDTGDFRFDRAYSLVVDGSRAERVDDNTKYVVLTFPPKLDSEWDGNAFNTQPEQNYTYEMVHTSFSLGGNAFDSTVQVVQFRDTSNFIFTRYAEERYANRFGLIYYEFMDIETQFEIDSGLHWIQILTDHSRL